MKNNGMIETEAWVLHKGPPEGGRGELRFEAFSFSDIDENEVLVEPLYGCWEGNMSHAIQRRPVDIARQRGEDKVVIGNSGVVRVLRKGAKVTTCEVGDTCTVFCVGIMDKRGYPIRILGYDAPGTMGVLSKVAKMAGHSLIPIPKNTQFSLQQWAAFSLRYVTGWSNWKVAYACWKAQCTPFNPKEEYVLAWGGGSSYSEAKIALNEGFNVAMICSGEARVKSLEAEGITALDRTKFPNLKFDPDAFKKDEAYKQKYLASERIFVDMVNDFTGGNEISILIDYIGLPVYRASLKVLGRQGVIATAGWKDGMLLTHFRAIECLGRHIHVHTHYANYQEGLEAVAYAEEKGWMPDIDTSKDYRFENIIQAMKDYDDGIVDSYFPIFKIND
jgi:NADPH:quinone reductase-like Zn-dependent oxidoreductase